MIQKILIMLCLTGLLNPALAAERGYFGAWFDDLPYSETKVQTGVIVKKVYAGMAAERAGLKKGEIVTRINGFLASDPPTAVELLAENAAGKKVKLTVIDRTGGGFRSFDIVAVMGDKPTAEFAKLKKTWVRCPSSKVHFCSTPHRMPENANGAEGHGVAAFLGWILFGICAVAGFGFFLNEMRRFRKNTG